ncbi:MAG: hypothetical protein IPI72_10625 [Flavobacteriales bacterium]|nr:hypothetical protein [Flavobacteriales bacterium]
MRICSQRLRRAYGVARSRRLRAESGSVRGDGHSLEQSRSRFTLAAWYATYWTSWTRSKRKLFDQLLKELDFVEVVNIFKSGKKAPVCA